MEEDGPLVSVIIPSYNRPKLLERAVRSVDDQTHSDIEIIVVETPGDMSHSGDWSWRTTEYPLHHITTAPNVRASEARNIGVSRSSGEYIAFLDDDDEWLPKKTALQVSLLKKADGARASMTGNKKITPDGEVMFEYTPSLPDDLVRYQLSWNIGTFSMLMIHHSVFDAVGGVDEELNRREDQDFLLRIAQETEFALLQRPLVLKHRGDYYQLGSDYDAGCHADEYFLDKHRELIRQYGLESEVKSAFELTRGRTALANGKYKEARRIFAKQLLKNPRKKAHYFLLITAMGGRVTHRIGREVRQRGWL